MNLFWTIILLPIVLLVLDLLTAPKFPDETARPKFNGKLRDSRRAA
ncbi:MAG TPA: hypothetical protein VHV08_00255 [Pirellulales bacterium]|jgi:hypothetical protein|nr:hypothetical protein [Pirellulales bacterium]